MALQPILQGIPLSVAGNRRPHEAIAQCGSESDDNGSEPPIEQQCGKFFCHICDKSFKQNKSLLRHNRENTHHLARTRNAQSERFGCSQCDKTFARDWDRGRHLEQFHQFRSLHATESEISLEDPQQLYRSHQIELETLNAQARSSSLRTMDSVQEADDSTLKSASLNKAFLSQAEPLHLEERPPSPVTVQTCHVRKDNSKGRMVLVPILEHDHRAEGIESSDESSPGPVDIDEILLTGIIGLRLGHSREDKLTATKVFSTKRPSVRHCPHCRKLFEKAQDLRAHFLEHLEDTRRIHICNECQVGFALKQDINRHLLSAEQKQYCGENFEHIRPCTGHHPIPDHSKEDQDCDHNRMDLHYLFSMAVKADKSAFKLRRSQSAISRQSRWSYSKFDGMNYPSWSLFSTSSKTRSRWTSPSLGGLPTLLADARKRISEATLFDRQTRLDLDLVMATKQGDLQLAQDALTKGANVNSRPFRYNECTLLPGETILSLATLAGHERIAMLLTEAGADWLADAIERYVIENDIAYITTAGAGKYTITGILLANGPDRHSEDLLARFDLFTHLVNIRATKTLQRVLRLECLRRSSSYRTACIQAAICAWIRWRDEAFSTSFSTIVDWPQQDFDVADGIIDFAFCDILKNCNFADMDAIIELCNIGGISSASDITGLKHPFHDLIDKHQLDGTSSIVYKYLSGAKQRGGPTDICRQCIKFEHLALVIAVLADYYDGVKFLVGTGIRLDWEDPASSVLLDHISKTRLERSSKQTLSTTLRSSKRNMTQQQMQQIFRLGVIKDGSPYSVTESLEKALDLLEELANYAMCGFPDGRLRINTLRGHTFLEIINQEHKQITNMLSKSRPIHIQRWTCKDIFHRVLPHCRRRNLLLMALLSTHSDVAVRENHGCIVCCANYHERSDIATLMIVAGASSDHQICAHEGGTDIPFWLS